MTNKKIPPKVKDLMRNRELVTAVDEMIEQKVSMANISKYLKTKGFEISPGYISLYKKLRNQVAAEQKHINEALENNNVIDVIKNAENKINLTSRGKIKRDLDYIDIVIQEGAKQLKDRLASGEQEISVKDVFDAIKLKEAITEGSYGGMTEYGIEHLQRMTEEKYKLLIKAMFSRIPEVDRKDALEELKRLEESFYKETDYYEDYLRSIGKSDIEIGEAIESKHH